MCEDRASREQGVSFADKRRRRDMEKPVENTVFFTVNVRSREREGR